MLYTDVRKEFPNISLGTVYRNLSLLSELGEIKRLTTGDGPDRFDGDTSTHHHFICRKCHCVTDLTMRDISEIKNVAAENFRGTIEDYSVNFYGICENCKITRGTYSIPRKKEIPATPDRHLLPESFVSDKHRTTSAPHRKSQKDEHHSSATYLG